MRSVTAALGLLTAVLAAVLAIPPGQALFGPTTAVPGASLTVIRDGAEEEASVPLLSRDVHATSAIAVPSGAPSVRPLPILPSPSAAGQPDPARPRPSPGAEDSQPGLDQIARIANILLNLPQVLSPPQARPSRAPEPEWP